MKFVLHTVCISPHQLPLAKAIISRIGASQYRYVSIEPLTNERMCLGWDEVTPDWVVSESANPSAASSLVSECQVLMSGIREFDVFETRTRRGLVTIYSSERWFKPIFLFAIPGGRDVLAPGWLRLLHPRYFMLARRFAKLIAEDSKFVCYPMGVWAKRDYLLICRLFGVATEVAEKKMRLWGYFVAPSRFREEARPTDKSSLRVLWVGRMIRWKKVETLIRAIRCLNEKGYASRIAVDIYGVGPMEQIWRKEAKGLPNVFFHAPVPIEEVRALMRAHDVYVLTSNGEEGWGAVVNEALEEGMSVLGTNEAGCSATILPKENLFCAGDMNGLATLLERCLHGEFRCCGIGRWTAQNAAKVLTERWIDGDLDLTKKSGEEGGGL